MKHTKTGTRCRPLSLLPSGAAIPALLFSLLSSFSSFAQYPTNNEWYTIPQSFEKDIKGYSNAIMKVQSNPNMPFDEVSSGTVYLDPNNQDSTLVHFISHDIYAQQVSSVRNKTYRNLNTRPGDYVDITHMRSVDIEAVDSVNGSNHTNRFFIVCQSREKLFGPFGIVVYPPPVTWGGVPWRDHITIMRVDEDGNVVGAVRDIFDQTPQGNIHPDLRIDGYNLYATHSLYREFSGNKILYICGYTTYQWSTYPNNPMFAHDKKSFVIALDADPDNTSTYLTPIASKTFDYEPGVVPDPNDSRKQYDYDIAMRMQWLEGPNNTDNLFVTGSVNGHQNNVTSPPNNPQFDYYRSGVMNFILDPLSLAVVQEHPYMSQGPMEPAGDNEYGVALWEDDPTTGSYFMVGNKFKHEARYVNEAWRIDPYGFDPRPDGIWVNQVSSLVLGPSGSNWRSVKNKNLWLTQILPTRCTTVNNGFQNVAVASKFLVAGMQAEALGTGFTNAPSVHNVNAFVADMSLDYATTPANTSDHAVLSGGIAGALWPTFTTNTGTGMVGTDANNFYTLGGGLANIMWYHNFTARNNTGATGAAAFKDDVVLVAPKMMDHAYKSPHPKYGTTDRYLGIKHIHVDAFQYDYGGNWDVIMGGCGREALSSVTLNAENVTTIFPCTQGALDLQWRDIDVAVDTLELSHNIPCAYQGGSEPSYKTGTTSVAAKRNAVSATKIYPNPANEEVRIDIAKEIADEAAVKVVLTNIHGQVISELYNGTAKGTAGKSMRLPQVATGLYIIHVYSNNTMIHQQKLSIQQ